MIATTSTSHDWDDGEMTVVDVPPLLERFHDHLRTHADDCVRATSR